MGETAEDAVVREVYEETGVRYEIDRLAVIHENFFTKARLLGEFGLSRNLFLLSDEAERKQTALQQQLYAGGEGGNALDSHCGLREAQGVSRPS